MTDILLDAALDCVKLLPFLFLTYLAMEYMEHKMGEKSKNMIRRSGKWGPFFGGLLGAAPQCGFSAAASNLYAGRVITVGTLVAVYLSTSDEMLPIFLASAAPVSLIARTLFLKVVIGIADGFLVDSLIHREPVKMNIHAVCHQDHCHCECDPRLVRSALRHTASIAVFVFAVTLVLNGVIALCGEGQLAALILNRPVAGEFLAGLIGLIPNCAASVVLTTLYLEGGMSFGAMMAGLLVGAGVGLLVLYKENGRHPAENLRITVILYLLGVGAGILTGLAENIL